MSVVCSTLVTWMVTSSPARTSIRSGMKRLRIATIFTSTLLPDRVTPAWVASHTAFGSLFSAFG